MSSVPGTKGLCVQWDLGTAGAHSPVLWHQGLPWVQRWRMASAFRSCGGLAVPQGKGDVPMAHSVPGQHSKGHRVVLDPWDGPGESKPYF